MRRSALGLCTSLLLIASAFGQSTMRNIPVPPPVVASAFDCGAATGYDHSLTITIAAQGSLTGDLTNKDMLFLGDTTLKSTGNGGYSQASGVDVVFCSKNDGTGAILPYEFVSSTYVASTGVGEWWVQVPTISKTTTKVIYALVGKASPTDYSNLFTITGTITGSFILGETVTQATSGATAALISTSPFVVHPLTGAYDTGVIRNWDGNTSGAHLAASSSPASNLWPNFLYVYHWGTSSSLGLTDSTWRCAAQSNHSATAVAGEVAGVGGAAFVGSSSQYITTCTLPSVTNFSVETWLANGATYATPTLGVWGSNSNPAGSGGLVSYLMANGNYGCGASPCGSAGYENGTGNYYYRYSSSALGSTNVWHHLSGTHASTGSANMTLYFDGSSETGGVNSGGSATNMSDSTFTMDFGRFGSYGSPFYYTGYIGEARFANIVLSADWILFDKTNQANPAGTYTVTTP